MNFYFDDYNKVVCDEDFEGIAEIYGADLSENKKIAFFFSSAELDFQVKLRKHYFIKVNNIEYPIYYRFIVQSEQFDNEYYYDGPLGAVYSEKYTDFYLWAPTAYSAKVAIIKNIKENSEEEKYDMHYHKGIYHVRVEGDLEKCGYVFYVEHDKVYRCLDPYAISSNANAKFNYVINTKKLHTPISNYSFTNKKDAIIYETHIRDFTCDKIINNKYPGKYKGFCQHNLTNDYNEKVGIDHLIEMGITHVQLLPIYDYGSIDELDHNHKYNWGYDPVQYNVMDGLYSINPDDPYLRINEVVDMVNDLHKYNIGVNMDVVYNHVFDASTFSLNNIVPYYFFRYEGDKYSNASFCGNEIRSNARMMRKFIIDSLCHLLRTFDFDGFRFDLMGILDVKTMNQIQLCLSQIKPTIMIYGEGWTMPTAINSSLCMIQKNHAINKNIGFFDDYFRDEVKKICGGIKNKNTKSVLKHILYADLYSKPSQTIQYVSCHDDYAIYDFFHYVYHIENPVNQIKLAFIFVLLSQGIAFIHAGSEFKRTKFGIKNTFNASEEINLIKWNNKHKNIDLYNYVCELIKIRKLLSDFRFDDIEIDRAHVKVEIDDYICVSYENKYQLLINFNDYQIYTNEQKFIVSNDGKRVNEKGNVIIMPYSYIFVKGE